MSRIACGHDYHQNGPSEVAKRYRVGHVIPLNEGDLRTSNVQVRFRSLSRKRATCKGCGRGRLMCSKRLGVCQICFHAALVR